MYCKSKKLLTVIMTVAMTFCMLFAFDAFSASADETVTEAPTTTTYEFVMNEKASVKIKYFDEAEVEELNNAIRFTSTIKATEEFNNHLNNFDVKVKTIIVKAESLSVLEGKAFTKANLDAYNENKAEADQIKYQQVIFSEGRNMPSEINGVYTFNACLYNVKDENFTKEFSAISYVEINGVATQYTETTATRSLWYVANAHKTEMLKGYPGGEEEILKSADAEEYAYVSSLCATYEVKVTGFDGEVATYNVKHGQYLDVDKIRSDLEVDGVAYFNGKLTAQDGVFNTATEIIGDLSLTADMDALAFTLNNGTAYSVSIGTYKTSNSSVIKVPATYNNLPVNSVVNKGFRYTTATAIILPDSVTRLGGDCFRDSSTLTYLAMPGVEGDIYNNCYNDSNLAKILVGDYAYFAGDWSDENQETTCDIYISATTYDSSVIIRKATTIFTGKVYVNNGETKGSWVYDANGFVEPWNSEYYYQLVVNDDDDNSQGAKVRSSWQENFAYSVTSDTTITITGAGADLTTSFADGVVTVPETIDGYTVTAIASYAFNQDTFIKKIILPDSVTSIGTKAFRQCTNLTYLYAGNVGGTVYGIAWDCYNLKTIVVKNGTSFASSDWKTDNASATGRMDVYLGEGETPSVNFGTIQTNTLFSMKVYLYSETEVDGGWHKVDGIAVPYDEQSYYLYQNGTLYKAWEPAFTYTVNTDRTSITITGRGEGFAFHCPGGVVVIPETIDGYTVTAIGAGAFGVASGSDRVTDIEKVILPNTVTSIANTAFRHCTGLTYLDVGTGISSLGQIAYGCDALTTIVVNNGTVFNAKGWETTGGAGQLNVYLRAGETPSVSITNVGNTLFTNKVYVYSETEVAGGWRYVDGVVTPYNVDSYYAYNNGTLTLNG